MKNQNKRLVYIFIVALIFTSLACSLGSGANTNSNNANPSEDLNLNQDAQPNSGNSSPNIAEETAVPTTAPETIVPTATIAHLTIPGSPSSVKSFLTDRSTKLLASEKRSNADNYDWLLIERPFTKDEMDYLAEIDIVRSEMDISSPWVYITISLEGSQPAETENYYGVEFDLNLDGRGNWLIFGQAPNNTEWTTNNVFVYNDKNGDNGGPTPMRGDGELTQLDGYESLEFESGVGDDPDAAWIRINPTNASQIQIALKYSLIQSDNEFLWGTWAAGQKFDQTIFDLHDHITSANAGSPVINSSDYPIKEVFAIDNTCRWGFGYIPTGNVPGSCYIPPTATPVPTPVPTSTPAPISILGVVFRDGNSNSVRNPGEIGINTIPINLGAGGCGSSGLASTTTAEIGAFSFFGLPAGTYCVTLDITTSCGGYLITTANKFTVNAAAGSVNHVIFGIVEYIC